MAHNILIFFKNIQFNFLKISFYDDSSNNFIFFEKRSFKKFDKTFFNVKTVNLKKINFNSKCINILYF